ncbi:MAG: hypothetical protein HYX53_00990 [Chloroflexi bacterium]|nr:hypothetical protein [Chloroflexota bacterium]
MTGWPAGLVGRARGQHSGQRAGHGVGALAGRLDGIERELAEIRALLARQVEALDALQVLVRASPAGDRSPAEPAAATAAAKPTPKRPRGLGRGLGALLTQAAPPPPAMRVLRAKDVHGRAVRPAGAGSPASNGRA